MKLAAAQNTSTTFVGLGSNLGDRAKHLSTALEALSQLDATTIVATSSVYESAPLGGLAQANYFNAVVKLSTTLSPWDFIRRTQAIETKNGRTRASHWAPRTLDLDILLFARLQFEDLLLTVPHAGIYMRNFVLLPLQEIAPNLRFPDGSNIGQRVKECPPSPINKLVIDEFQPSTKY